MDLSQYFDKIIDWLGSQLIISIPVDRSFITDKVYRDYEIIIEDKILIAYLIPIELKEFDAILVMDWLSMHGANLDCLKNEVVLHTLDGQSVCFVGVRNMIPSCLILALMVD